MGVSDSAILSKEVVPDSLVASLAGVVSASGCSGSGADCIVVLSAARLGFEWDLLGQAASLLLLTGALERAESRLMLLMTALRRKISLLRLIV